MSSPIIFEKGTRDFSTLGLGLLSDAIQAKTTEELNGQFIFEMDYPVSGNNADLIKENRIIVVNSGHILKRQGFVIRQIVRKIDLTMTVYAEHVSYATLDVALSPIGTISGDAKTALENWKRMLVPAVDFTVDSDILTTNSTSIGAPEFETARQGLGGHTGSILDVWGGEYQFDNWHIRLLKQRGKFANAIIAYGRNLISFEQDTNIADTYTSVYPYYQENSGDEGNKNHFLPERTVDSEFVGKYPNPKVLMLDLSNKFKDVADYSETKLRNYALSYIQSNNIGVPKVNMKISTVDLSRATCGFSEDIDLGDTVNVYFEKLGITTSAKVIKAVWNVLSDDYDKFEIGARRASLTESISELATTADENANKALNQALVAQQSADGKTTIYYLDSSDPWPTKPKENDTAFVKDGENNIMYRYMFNNDTGVFSWVKILDSMSADQIKQRVSDALESGKAYSDQLVAENASQVNATLSDVQAKQADLSAHQVELDTKAQGYADKALVDAKADTLATAVQTAKGAQIALNNAETTLQQEISQKVSQSDYDAKTGDLTVKASTAQQTADQANTTIGNYKQANDGRVGAAETKIEQNSTAISQKVSQSDYDQKTGELSGQISSVSQTAGEIIQSVSNVQTQVNTLSQVNLINNSDFRPDLSGWSVQSPASGTVTTGDYDYAGNVMVLNNIAGGILRVNSVPITLTGTKTVSYTFNYYIFGLATNGEVHSQLTYLDSSMKEISGSYPGGINLATTPVGSWQKRTVSNLGLTPPTGSTYIVFSFDVRGAGTRAGINRPILVRGSTVGDYVPGQYVNNDKISTVSQTVDGISSIVSDPATGLTKRVQTAEGTLSQVTGADIPALQKATYWQSPVGYDLNTYLTQGSFFFRDTTARTNSPTTSTKWMYLTVDRNAQGDRVTQTVWYDTQTDAKITYRRQYAGTWGAWYANDNDSVATIAQTNGAIQTEISNRATGDTNTLTQAKDFTTSSITSSESGMRSQITQTSDAILAKIEAGNLVTNSEFDPDNVGWYKLPVDGSTIDVSGKVTTPVRSYYADWDAVNGSRGIEFGATTGTWITSEPVRASSTGTYSISVLAGRPTATTTAVTMDFRLGLWDKDKKYITSVGSTNPLNGTTYLPLKYYKSENITVPSNTAFVSFVLGHSGSGTPDAIYHPMINHGFTASPYTPTYGTTASSTVLSLLKDNWSIGIADNAGAITSGIVGNSSNMALISNSVTINSPQTQIKGTAWINSAMIGNGAIGKAQIGDASIDTAKIASLDVAKLTGNVSNFIQSNWNGIFASTSIDSSGMSINGGGTVTRFDTTGAHYYSGVGINATYSFGKWRDNIANTTSSTGLYLGATGSSNTFMDILGPDGSASVVLAGPAMDFGNNTNIVQNAWNSYVDFNARGKILIKGNRYSSPAYIEGDEGNRTMNFFTGGGSVGGGNYFYFNQNVISSGTFSSTSILSKKNVKSVYDEDALGEIAKTQLVNFAYKNRPDQNHVSPIIDDVNSEKEYYIPKTILGQDNEYVDMYSMISMAWKAIQQLNEKIGEK